MITAAYDPVLDRARDAVLRVLPGIADARLTATRFACPGPVPAHGVDRRRRAVARVAEGDPLNGAVEIGGPMLSSKTWSERRPERAATSARWSSTRTSNYSGAEMDDRTLVPDDGARLGEIRLDDWLSRTGTEKAAVA